MGLSLVGHWQGRDCGFGSKKMFLTPGGFIDSCNVLCIYYILYISYIKAALRAVKIIIISS